MPAALLLDVGDVFCRLDEGAELADRHLMLAEVERSRESDAHLPFAGTAACLVLRRSNEERARRHQDESHTARLAKGERQTGGFGVFLLIALCLLRGEGEARRGGRL